MPFFGESDIDALIAATGGRDCTIGAVTVKGLVDIIDEAYLQDGSSTLQGKSVTVTVKTGAFATLAVGNTMTVDGVSYRVMRFDQAAGDGALTEIHVART